MVTVSSYYGEAMRRDALGIGLRLPHLLDPGPLLASRAPVDYLEVISENFFGRSARLARFREHYPIVLHGVGLNLLGHEPLDDRYLDALARLADDVDAPFFTDHLCWTGAHGVRHHDLLPAPYTEDLASYAAERAEKVQARVGRPFGIENLSSYVTFAESAMPEHEFYARVVRESGCWSLLDINNIYVSSQNHHFDPDAYLAAIDFSRVLQVHLAGHVREGETLIDTHDQEVAPEVWALYARAWKRGGPFPTLIEWDAKIPALSVLLGELEKAKEARA